MNMKKLNTSGPKKVRVLDGIPMLIIVAVLVAALIVVGFIGSNNTRRILVRIFLYCTMASMWNLMSGYTGMTSLGQQAFVGLAGYSMAVITTTCGLSYVAGWAVGGAVGAVIALILSVILFRMRGMYFAIATWVIAEAFKTFFTSWKFVKEGNGMSVSGRPGRETIYLMALGLLVVALVVIYLLLKSRIGLGLTAMRDDADAASSVGVNIFKSKLLCFVIAGLFTALAGGLYFLNNITIYPTSGFSNSWTVAVVFITIIGGIGTMAGPIVGTLVYILLDEILVKLLPGEWTNIVLGAIAILVILFLPDGILGTLQKKLNFEILSQKRFSKE